MKTIFLLPPLSFPIPAVKGGAVEQLITYLLEENERFGDVRFVVLSKYDGEAIKHSFKNSKVYYCDPGTFDCNCFNGFSFAWKAYKLKCKIFNNSVLRKIFKQIEEPLGKYHYLCKYIAKREKVDAISIEGQWEVPFAFLNKIVGKENLFTHIHTSRYEDSNIRNRICNSISISQYVQNLWTKTEIPNSKNHVVYNAANIELFQQEFSEKSRFEIRKRYGVNEELLLLYCGRIIPEKGVLQLVQAMELLSDLPIKLLLVGSVAFSHLASSDYESEVIKASSKLDNVCLAGFIHNESLPEIYNACDIQIIPSIWEEGAGLVAIEGMASGLPLIVTKSGGMVEYVSEDTALIIPKDDNLSQNIANAVIELYRDPPRRKAMANAGRERAQQFSKEIYYRNFVKIFSDKD